MSNFLCVFVRLFVCVCVLGVDLSNINSKCSPEMEKSLDAFIIIISIAVMSNISHIWIHNQTGPMMNAKARSASV